MTRRSRPIAEGASVIALGVAAVYVALLPVGGPGGLPAPDLLYALLAAWVVRRPAQAPAWAVLALGVFADLLLSHPVGLGALGLLLVTEVLRANAGVLRGTAFPLEWLAVTAGFAALLAGQRLILQLAFADGPGLAPALRYGLSTALAYPLVVALLHWVVGLRALRQAPARALGALG